MENAERRAPVQSCRIANKPAGTIAWPEHVLAWERYRIREGYGCQSAERIAERCGFGYDELTNLLGHEPKTWKEWAR